jgi:hypothetical protein
MPSPALSGEVKTSEHQISGFSIPPGADENPRAINIVKSLAPSGM